MISIFFLFLKTEVIFYLVYSEEEKKDARTDKGNNKR